MRIVASFVSVLIAGTLSFTTAQENIPSKDELLQNVPQLANIPGFADFNTSSIRTEEIERALRQKCDKNGGPTAYDIAKSSPGNLMECIESLVNLTQLTSEMAEARPKGDLDTVFVKYCRRVPNLKRCVRNVTDSLEPCLESEERQNVKIIHNITNSLLEFICHNEGNRIAMFIAAGGIECFKSKENAVMTCANETFNTYVPAAQAAGSAPPGALSIPLLVLSLKECTDIEKFRTCTVKVLEECNDPTPANVVESLFNFVKRVTPCEEMLNPKDSPTAVKVTGNSGFSSHTSVDVLLITVAMVMSLRFA